MTTQRAPGADLRIARAITELQAMIRARYPSVAFAVSEGDDPEGTYLMATVDVEDTDAVVDVVIERLLALQVEEQLPVYVVPVRPPERLAAMHQRVDQFQGGAAVLPAL